MIASIRQGKRGSAALIPLAQLSAHNDQSGDSRGAMTCFLRENVEGEKMRERRSWHRFERYAVGGGADMNQLLLGQVLLPKKERSM